jgi:5'-deoxynucleotidase YfbR-like HD superfamily hydrolase
MIRKTNEIISRLASVKRYSDHRLCNDESVLEHSGYIALICLMISEKLNNRGAKIDIGIVLSKAILHDIDEIVTGDIAMPIKYYSDDLNKEIKKMEFELTKKVFDGIDQKTLFPEWRHAKAGKEGSIVKLCDFLAVVYKVHDEVVLRGNKTMTDIALGGGEKIHKLIKNCKETIEDIRYTDHFCFGLLDEIEMEANELIKEILGQKNGN